MQTLRLRAFGAPGQLPTWHNFNSSLPKESIISILAHKLRFWQQYQLNVIWESRFFTSTVFYLKKETFEHRPDKLLTVSSRGRLSLTAPTQPRQPITMMMVPTAMSKLAADKEGRDDDRVAKFPWVTESQTPTPSMPHPPNCRGNTKTHCQSPNNNLNPHRNSQMGWCTKKLRRLAGTSFFNRILVRACTDCKWSCSNKWCTSLQICSFVEN